MKFRPACLGVLGGILLILLFSSSSFAQCSSSNPIVAENCLPGTSPGIWDISGAGDPTIQGFATDISVNVGETVNFKINTTAAAYTIDIYRMGYYGGMGARLITTITPSATLPQIQAACLSDASTGLVDCGNWAVSASWQVPVNAVSGIYFAHLVRSDTHGDSHIVFVVRNDNSSSDVLFQTSDETWQAYNGYGGHSIYGPDQVFDVTNRAYKVSYNRPFDTRGFGFESTTWVFGTEYPMVRWLERNGYDVTYFTGIDAARNGNLISRHKIYLSVGHDEYWSGQQRANVEAARDRAVNLAFFSGNEAFWKTRLESSIDGTNTPNRTLVCYKETLAGMPIDPLDPPVWTGTWRDARFSPPADAGRPENALTGTLYMVNGIGGDNNGTLSIMVPAADAKMRFWRNTSLANLASGTTATLPAQTLGYEWDEDIDNGVRPAGTFDLSTATYNLTTDLLLDQGATYGAGAATHHMTLHRAPSGALVFGAGTIQWSWGLDSNHDDPFGNPQPEDPDMQQATVNLFADMGVQPAGLQTGLVATAASTDTVAPASTIVWPTNGAILASGSAITISGTANDSGGGVVGGVELSTDGGNTWHPANGRTNWSYSWTPNNLGSFTLKTRATDDSANTEVPNSGISVVTVAAGDCPCSDLSAAGTPSQIDANDGSAVEVGVRFRADFDGYVTGVRFYKAGANTGTHIGNLWSNTGTLLGSAIFTNETSSGWQQVSFNKPVPISANTTYVASYFAPLGHYSATSGAFLNSGVDAPPLHFLASGVDGLNGVFSYGSSSTFPTSSFNAASYWVDVVYVPASSMPGAPPAILVNPSTLGFSASAGGANPPSAQTVNVYNQGDGSVTWSATASSNTPWLIVSANSGSSPATSSLPSSFAISVNTSGLTPGTYTGTVTVTPTGVTNTSLALNPLPQTITVSLSIGANLLFFSDFGNGTMDGWAFSPLGLNGNWSVANGSLNYNGGGPTQVYAGDSSWTDYSLSAAIKLATLNDYPGGIRGHIDPVSGSGYVAWLYPAEGLIRLFRINGWSVDSKAVTVTVLGTANAQFDTANFHNLQLSFQGSQIQVSYDSNVVITATDSTYSSGLVALDVHDQVIRFTNVTVTSANTGTDSLTLDINSLNLNASSQSNPAPQNVKLNSTGGILAWTARADQPWLSVSPTYGTTPASLQISASTSGLNSGSHGTITVVSLGSVDTTQTITVTVAPTIANTSTTVTSSANPANFGQAVTLTATVAPVAPATGTPSGTVTFTDGTTVLASSVALSAGTATFQTSNLTAGTHTIAVNYSGDSNFAASSGSLSQTINTSTPTITWVTPADITYGTPLSSTQLDATASVPGSFAYAPAAGTVLGAGNNQKLSVTFTPTDTTNYATQTSSVTINVGKAAPTITWANPADITYGKPLGSAQLDATATVPGSFVYTPLAGTVLGAGNNQKLSVTFTPTDTTNYATQTSSVTINVVKAASTVTWANPGDITYGTALSSTQLNATASVPGTFVYSPAAATVLNPGSGQKLSVTFTPTDSNNYASQTATVLINVIDTPPVARNDAYSVDENTTLTVPVASGVLINDSATGGNPLSVSPTIVNGATTHGTVTLNADGSLTYTPTTGYYGPDSFTYTATDGFLTSNTATVNLTVNFLSATQTVAAGGSVTTDPTNAGTTATVPVQTSVTSPVAGSVSIGETATTQAAPNGYSLFTDQVNITAPAATAANPLVLVFTLDVSLISPGQNEKTTQVFRNGVLVAACDGTLPNGASPDPCVSNRALLTNGDVQLTVRTSAASRWNFGSSLSNTPPVAVDDSYSTNAGVTLSVPAPGVLGNDTDVDLNTLTAITQTTTAHGTLTLNSSGSFTYIPATGYAGSDSFTYVGNDGKANSNVATVSITVKANSTTSTLTSSLNPSTYGQGVTLTATISSTAGIPTGTVTFKDGGVALGSAVALNASGVATYQTSSLTTGTHNLTADYTASGSFAASTGSLTQTVNAASPTITWTNPADITYGTALSSTQLDATASVPGSFAYSPAAGVIPGAGTQKLSVTFTPTDTTNYATQTSSVTINVVKAAPTITWAAPANITYGTALSASQLNASSSVPGTFAYSPAAGAILGAGSGQKLSVTFTPNDTTNYTAQTASVLITVTQATPTITWAAPANITYGSALSATQLNATSTVPGTLAYSPATGTILGAGNNQKLSVTFTPTDTANYTPQTASVLITVTQAKPTITWAAPANITYGTALSATQLNANSSVPGTFAYSPAAGTVLGAGSGQKLSVAFTPTDAANYTTQTASVLISVLQAAPTITWATPANITYGTALSATQLDASSSVPGALAYSPAAGTILGAGSGQRLSVTFTPTDTTNYTTQTASVLITVTQGTPTITWATPANVAYGTALSSTQLNATGSIPGSFTYTPGAGTVLNPGPSQKLSVTFTPNDVTDYSSQNSSVLINVVDNAPVAVNDSYSVNENTTLTVPAASGVLINDSDTGGNAMMAALIATPTNGTVTLKADGSFTYTPATGYYGPDTFTYTATDGFLTSNVATVNITVNLLSVSQSVSTGGTVNTDTNNTGTSASVPVQTALTSPNAGPVSIAETATTQAVPQGYSFFNQQVNITAPAGSASSPLTLVFTVDVSLITPGQNQNTTQVFRDGAAVANCTSVNPSIAPVPCVSNRVLLANGDVQLTVLTDHASAWNIGKSLNNSPPVAANDSYAVNAGAILTVAAPGLLANDTDPDLNTLYAVNASSASHGTLTVNSNGSFTYTPTAGYSGADSFTYYANDGKVNSLTPATVSIQVRALTTTNALTSSLNPSTYGQSVTFTATVTSSAGTPTGTVQFYDGSALLGNAAVSNGSASFTTNAVNAGTRSITAVYSDPNNNFAGSTSPVFTQTVNKASATATFTFTPTSQQYSDPVTFKATLAPVNGASPATSAQFKVASQIMGTQNFAYNSSTGLYEATLTVPLLETSPTGQLSPGSKLVTASFTSTNYSILNRTGSLGITAEDARTHYAGQSTYPTNPGTSTATIPLQWTIKDITAVGPSDPAYDPYPGDITLAKVTFVNRTTGAAIATVPVTATTSDKTVGTATYNWAVDIGTATSQAYTVGVVVTGYYTRNNTTENATITVNKQ